MGQWQVITTVCPANSVVCVNVRYAANTQQTVVNKKNTIPACHGKQSIDAVAIGKGGRAVEPERGRTWHGGVVGGGGSVTVVGRHKVQGGMSHK